MSKTSPFRVFSGTNSRYLAEKICNSLGCKLGNMNIMHFADGEFAVSYEESIRGAHVFLVQSTFPNSDNLMELLLMIDAAKRASAKSIVAVIPYFGWARQDRKDKPRVSIGAKLVADLLSIALVHSICLRLGRASKVLRRGLQRLYQSSFFVYLSHCLFLTLGTAFLQRHGVAGLSCLLSARLLICYTLPFLTYFLYDALCTRFQLRWRLLG